MEGNQASVSCVEFSLEIRGEAVGAVDLGTGLFRCGDVAGVGVFESVDRTENSVVGRIFPGDGWEGRGFLEIRRFLGCEALASEEKTGGFFALVEMKVKLPRSVPPQMGFDFDGVSEMVGAGQVIFFDGKGAGLLSSVQGTILHLGCEGGVDRVKTFGKLDIEADAGAVEEFAPFIGAEDGIGGGDGSACVEEFDFAFDRANDQFGGGDWVGKVGVFGRKRLFRVLPEWG